MTILLPKEVIEKLHLVKQTKGIPFSTQLKIAYELSEFYDQPKQA
jgi:hypothetical protein